MFKNTMKTGVLLASLGGLIVAVATLLGGRGGATIGLVLAFVMVGGSYWFSDKLALRSARAQVITEADSPEFYGIVRSLAERANLPMPTVAISPSDQPNAFATGRDPAHAAVAATTGLLTMLDRREIRAVMGHELAHVKNRDTLTMTVTATIAGAISALANFAFFFGGNDRERPGGIIGVIAIAILAPMAAALVQMAISRGREYEADAGGAEISGDPQALASALQKIDAYARSGRVNIQAERNPATAHMFIINPLNGHGADNLFSTHPSTSNRVAALSQKFSGNTTSPPPDMVTSTRKRSPGPWDQQAQARKPGPWG